MKSTLSRFAVAGCLVILMAGGCAKKTVPAPNQQATVTLKDGTSFAGTVTKSSTSEISLVAANGETRTYPMSQVDSVNYVPAQNGSMPVPSTNTATAPAPASQTNPPAATPAPVQQAPPPAQQAHNIPPPPVERSAPPAPREPAAVVRTIPIGTAVVVRNNETIDSHAAAPGQRYSAVITQSVLDSQGRVAIPRGSNGTLIVRAVEAQGRVKGQSELALDLESVSVSGRRYRLDTGDLVQKGHEGLGKNKRTAGFVGGGTVLGTLLGAVAGGGKGAAIGAISGAAAGTATQTLTRGRGVRVPAETLLTFRLESPVRITEMR